MSYFSKYHKETRDADGEPLWWPGGPDGFPFRGQQPPPIKDQEYEKLEKTGKFKCNIFYLDKPADLARYMSVRDKCANGLWFMVDIDRQWDQETKNYRVYLEWVEVAYEVPAARNVDAIREYTKNAEPIMPGVSRLAGLSQGW